MINSQLLLYIDPGTGSMLFSIIIGATATLFFLLKAAFLKLKMLFSAKKGGDAVVDSKYHEYVIYNEGKQYWNVFKPVCDEFEKRKIEVTYFTSDKEDFCFKQNYNYVKPEIIGEGNKAFVTLNMISAKVVLMTTPGLQVYQMKRSKNVKHYAHILHAPNDAIMYRLFGLDYFDSVLVNGDYQKEGIQAIEAQRDIKKKDIVTVGCPYLDVYKKNIESIPEEKNHPFTVLLSPSWGESGLLTRFGEKLLTPLAETGWRIIVRPHPQTVNYEPKLIENLQNKYKTFDNVQWDFERENIYSLKKADVMISDFSGIIYDYTFLCDKPVIYVKAGIDLRPYDAYDLKREHLWLFKSVEKFGTELKEDQFGDIKNFISSISDNEELAKARKQAKAEAWMYEGEAGKRVVDYLTSIEK